MSERTINDISEETAEAGHIEAAITVDKDNKDLIAVSDVLPPNLFLLPVLQTSIFPGMIVPVILPSGKLTKTIDHVLENNGYIGIVLAKDPKDSNENLAVSPPTSMTGLPMDREAQSKLPEGASGRPIDVSDKNYSEFYEYGVMAKVLKRINLPDNQVSVLLSGVHRFRMKKLVNLEPHYVATVDYLLDDVDKGSELEALLRSALSQFKVLSKDNPLISEEVKVALVNIDGPGKLTDLMASVLVRDIENYQSLLAANDVKARLQHLLLLLRKEQDVQSYQKKIHEEINQKVASAQRDYYLSEQLKVIQRELGQHADEKTRLLDKFRKRLKTRKLTKEAKTRVEEEFEKLETLHEQSSEYSVALNYLDWVTAIPWGIQSEENYSLQHARKVLESEHHGLKEAKARILEYLAVKKLKQSAEGSIICLVGPPGTGKTSLGRSIAKALGRKFFRFSVGGMRDEAEIKGHRRTYVGALPGKIIQGIKRVGTQNPVFLIDEIDKIGTSFSVGGDPASALLELLDPEQNKEFLDHYLDIPFDCSEVFFITTANTTDSIPSALLDRTEVIELHGYTDHEKYHIATKYLIPRQMKKHGLKSTQLKFSNVGIRHIISHYAREAGVRNLEKYIAKICRKAAYRVAMGSRGKITLDSTKVVEKYLGLAPYEQETGPNTEIPGVATGLAWTQYGGEVLYVESLITNGKGGMTLTGSLGDVMQESANIAHTYVRQYSKKLKLSEDFFENNAIHLHVPAGATPKDGPSAGVTMAASMISRLSKKPIKKEVAMTGELTLTGQILPVGGIKEKLLAAKRMGIKTVLLPKANERDLKDVEPEIRRGLKVIKASRMQDCLKHLF